MALKPPVIRHVHSSGGVVYRRVDGLLEIALIATRRGAVWTLPKGLIDRNETPEETALREIVEETGLHAVIRSELGKKSYWFYLRDENVKCRKTVFYYLLECVGGDIGKYGEEVDDAKWFDIGEAALKVTYRSDREIIERASIRLDQQEPGKRDGESSDAG